MKYVLKTITGTWSSVEIQKAVRVGYKVLDVYEQHQFNKKQAKVDGNKGLEAIAKLCINSLYVKWGYNPSKAKGLASLRKRMSFHGTCSVFGTKCLSIFRTRMSLWHLYKKATSTRNTEHGKSNVYISTFVTAYACLK